MKNSFFRVVIVIVLSVSGVCFASSEIERQELARIKNILQSLRPLINVAQTAQDKHERVNFRYAWLRSDINKIISGIDVRLTAIHVESRTVEPLEGDYLVMRSAKQ